MSILNFNGSIVAPSMDTSGWLIDAESKYDRLLAYFLTTNINQGAMFGLELFSCASIIAEYGNFPELLRSNMQSSLNKYFSKHYEKCSVDVSIDETVFENNSNKYAINIAITAYDTVKGSSQVFSYARLATFANSRFMDVVKINNGE